MNKTIILALLLTPFFSYSQADKVYDKATHQYTTLENPNSSENEYKQNFSAGIAYYNRAVTAIKNTDYETDVLTINKINENCKELFNTALPYLEKCYTEKPTDKNTLVALSGIYFSMDDMKQHNKMEKELAELK